MSEKSLSILIVDDDEKILEMLTKFIERTNLSVKFFYAQNGQDAVFKMRNQKFDLVIMDNFMPRMTGVEVVSHMKTNPDLTQAKKTPVLFISGGMTTEYVQTLLDFGVKNIMVKPFTAKDIANRVSDIFTAPAA